MTEHTTSYYAASANKYEPFPTLEESITCDVCVVGGGYTGLSSALHLAEMGYDVVVLEGARIGFGASGRNGGQLVNSYSRDIDVIEKNYGPDAAKMLGSMMFEGGDIIRERIQRYQIQCDYRPGGLFVAMNHKQMETLEEQKSQLGALRQYPTGAARQPCHSSRSRQRPLRRRPARPQRRPYSPAEPRHRRSGRHSS
jgi:gamma-glutamylputrescine oxidase